MNAKSIFFAAIVFILVLASCTNDQSPTTPASPTAEVFVAESPQAQPLLTRARPSPTPQAPAEQDGETSEPPTAPAAEPTAVPTPAATGTPETHLVTSLRLQMVASGLVRPLYITHAGDSRLFVVEQDGRIMIVENGAVLDEPFLDIQNRISSLEYEQGLLSVAFHPEYASNGLFYVYYTDGRGDTVVSRFSVNSDDPDRADAASENVLLQIDQPYANHNGGLLKFGPDGYLYIGLGDGGSAGDPRANGQNPGTLLGSILRIDVDAGDPYAIPADNPFAVDSENRAEIWAYGLRNPWRFSFDRLTGDLYIADVGQSMWEEVHFETADSPGGANYGWNILEGSHCYAAATCDNTGLALPVAEYDHPSGGCSITGGYVYRGTAHPEFWGNYFYADYCSGMIWALVRGTGGSWSGNLIVDTELLIPTFGEDAAGELYVANHAGGAIYRIVP